MASIVHQTPLQNRIASLDFLRGIAVLGILIINIESFAYPDPWSPYKYGFDTALDSWTRFWVYFLAQGKFFGMFTLLFGVGFYVFLERLEHQNVGLKAMDIYARRLLWLFIIGVVHAYLIWDGDVLYHYAICGFLLFPFRSFSVNQLLLVLLVPIAILMFNAYQQTTHTQASLFAYQAAKEKIEAERTPEEIQIIKKWEQRTAKKQPDIAAVEMVRQTYIKSINTNAEHTKVHKGEVLYSGILYRTLIMMILGIVLYKSGIFHNYQNLSNYWIITLAILAFALLSNYVRYYHWTFEYNIPVISIWKNWLITFPKELLALAYILLLNGLFQKYWKKVKIKILSPIGRMALTNYIVQSIILGFIFYGYGLGKFNQYSRFELLFVVAVIWFILIVFSVIVMSKYKQGPLEWLWRKLTYRSFR